MTLWAWIRCKIFGVHKAGLLTGVCIDCGRPPSKKWRAKPRDRRSTSWGWRYTGPSGRRIFLFALAATTFAYRLNARTPSLEEIEMHNRACKQYILDMMPEAIVEEPSYFWAAGENTRSDWVVVTRRVRERVFTRPFTNYLECQTGPEGTKLRLLLVE
jgi:hypothetical protein